MTGERGEGRVVEHERRRQAQARRRVQAVTQVHGEHRVEPEIPEGPCGLDRLPRLVAEHEGDVRADQVEDLGFACRCVERGQACGEPGTVGAGSGGRGTTARRPHDAAQYVGQRTRRRPGAQRHRVQDHGQEVRLVGTQSVVEEGEPLVVHEGPDSPAQSTRRRGALGDAGHAAGLRPGSPAQRDRGFAGGAALLSECVEEGVRRRVVGLTAGAEHARGGGEEDEGGQVQVAGQFVQVDGTVDLGAQHRVQLIVGHAGHDTVVQHTGSVHHTRQTPRNALQDTGQGVPVGRVAGFDHHRHAQRGQLLHQLTHTRRVHPPTPDQHQLTDPVAHRQMPGHQTTQGAGATGDQNSALTPRHHLPIGHRVPDQTRHTQCAVPHRHFTLTDRQRGAHIGQPVLPVRLDEDEPAGVLRLRRPHQTRHHTARTPRHHHQPRGLEPRIGQPGPHHTQHPSSHPMDVRPVEAGQNHHLRRTLHRAQLRVVTIKHHHLPRELPLHRPHGRPIDPVHPPAGPRLLELLDRDALEQQGADVHHRSACLVTQFDGDLVGAEAGEPYTYGGGAGRGQGDVGPAAGYQELSVCGVVEGHAVERGIQQRRVDAEALRCFFARGQRHVGVDVLTDTPCRREPPEQARVSMPDLGQALVEGVEVDGVRTRRRPHCEPAGLIGRALPHRQHGGRVAGPGGVGVGVRPARVDAQPVRPALFQPLDADLDLYGAPLGDHQRRFHDELFEQVTAHFVGSADRQVDDGRTG
ncbi:hypothetical protein GCM10018772_62430 [Streptomyces fumanus]|uniref:Uncharacterized protein n=1 Tax=Streptomyces fumanus TaxID=67302 RepID=A0A919AW12_9ACTN|nr:hypothetical protein GCM10018772_62430 [Streptomyces fumanus]